MIKLITNKTQSEIEAIPGVKTVIPISDKLFDFIVIFSGSIDWNKYL